MRSTYYPGVCANPGILKLSVFGSPQVFRDPQVEGVWFTIGGKGSFVGYLSC